MKQSETITKIAPALLKAQKGIKAAIKDATNPHFKSKYADLSSVIDAVKESLNAQGIAFLQGVEDAENGVAVETMLLHDSGEWLSSTIKIPASKQDAQGYGSAMTYARRYGLQAMCGVPAEDDDGNAAVKAVPESAKSIGRSEFDKLQPKDQQMVTDIATEVIDEFNSKGAEPAYEMYSQARDNFTDPSYVAALRGLFPSHIKTAFTKLSNQLTAKAA